MLKQPRALDVHLFPVVPLLTQTVKPTISEKGKHVYSSGFCSIKTAVSRFRSPLFALSNSSESWNHQPDHYQREQSNNPRRNLVCAIILQSICQRCRRLLIFLGRFAAAAPAGNTPAHGGEKETTEAIRLGNSAPDDPICVGC